MNSKPKLTALAFVALLFGTSAAAVADHDQRTARNDRAQYDYAKVVSSQAIVNTRSRCPSAPVAWGVLAPA